MTQTSGTSGPCCQTAHFVRHGIEGFVRPTLGPRSIDARFTGSIEFRDRNLKGSLYRVKAGSIVAPLFFTLEEKRNYGPGGHVRAFQLGDSGGSIIFSPAPDQR